MTTDHDVVVIGGGAMGSATAWQLAGRGRQVTLFERFEEGHHRGASHGRTRNFNVAYTEDDYVALLVEARRLWHELESESGSTLLDLVGVASHGPSDGYDDVHAALTAASIRSELLDIGEAERRWPGIRFDTRVHFAPDAGVVYAADALRALQSRAVASGAVIRHSTPVASIEVLADDRVRIEIDAADGRETHTARRVVVTVGAWTQRLIGGAVPLPRLVVTQEQPAHFAVRDHSIAWPSFNHRPGTTADYDYWRSPIYGMLTPGEGVKAGWHGVGPIVDPDRRDFSPEPAQLADLQRYARDWLPGVDADDYAAISCTYTTTDSTDFVLDRFGPVVVGAGFSGHGFKFTPAIGRILADLATDGPLPAPRFAARR